MGEEEEDVVTDVCGFEGVLVPGPLLLVYAVGEETVIDKRAKKLKDKERVSFCFLEDNVGEVRAQSREKAHGVCNHGID